MVQSTATTVPEYLAALPPQRRATIEAVRSVILKSLPEGYEEVMLYGMISYVVPHTLYPRGYHCDPSKPLTYLSLAAQKNYYALYLMNVYADKAITDWFLEEYKKSGKKLNMGKSCVRFRNLEDLPLDLIRKVVARTPAKALIRMYENARAGR